MYSDKISRVLWEVNFKMIKFYGLLSSFVIYGMDIRLKLSGSVFQIYWFPFDPESCVQLRVYSFLGKKIRGGSEFVILRVPKTRTSSHGIQSFWNIWVFHLRSKRNFDSIPFSLVFVSPPDMGIHFNCFYIQLLRFFPRETPCHLCQLQMCFYLGFMQTLVIAWNHYSTWSWHSFSIPFWVILLLLLFWSTPFTSPCLTVSFSLC